MQLAAEANEHPSVWEAYLEVMSDPGHLLAEMTFVLILDVLLLGVVVPFLHRALKRRLERLHQELDVEHNVDHGRAVAAAGAPQGVRRGPTVADVERLRVDGMNEWVVQMLVEHYRVGETVTPPGPRSAPQP